MTDPANRDLEASAEPKADTLPSEARGSSPRKPYRAPQLRHLGSVRELTLGGTPTAGDVAAGMGNIAMM